MQAIPRVYDSNSAITLIIFGVFLILAIVSAFNKEDFQEFITIFKSDKYFQESKKQIKPIGVFTKTLYFVQTLIIPLLLTMILLNLKIVEEEPMFLFVKVFLLYFVVITGKYLIEKMLGVLFSTEKIMEDYIFFKITYKNFLALCCLPVLLFITYNWQGSALFFQILIGLFLLVNLFFLNDYYRKNLKIISSNFYYFILYLCIFEIAPYYILYKVIS